MLSLVVGVVGQAFEMSELAKTDQSRQIVQSRLAEIRLELVDAKTISEIKRIFDIASVLSEAAKRAKLSFKTVYKYFVFKHLYIYHFANSAVLRLFYARKNSREFISRTFQFQAGVRIRPTIERG
jgi:hypothetical protein